jgi:hypothetical protein
MKREARKDFAALVLLVGLLGAEVHAGWSMKKLPDTGQTVKYTTTFGEDADYTINPPSFTDNGNGTITDNVTGLIWQKADGGEMTWENAAIYASWLNLGGQTDWRLPTVHELFSILNHGRNPALDSTCFTQSAAEYWWSSDVQAGDSSRVWATNSGGGAGPHQKTETISAGGGKRYHVRCVRGAAPPTNRPIHSFKDNQDGTVTDPDTTLVWQRLEVSPAMTWEEALKYAENLVLVGKSDWRLPNIKELQSLNDETFINPSIDRAYFPGATAARYWSSTTLFGNQPTRAWFMDFQSGIASYDDKTLARQVRCVRGGTTDSTLASLTLQAGGATAVATLALSSSLQAGYATTSIQTGNAPYGTAVFSLMQNGVVVSEAGVPPSPPTTAARLFVDHGIKVPSGPLQSGAGPVDVYTGIAVVNPGTSAANVTYTLRDVQGQTLAVGHGTLAAGVHRARFLNQLSELAPDFVLPPGFASSTRYGTLEVASEQALSVLALRMTVNQGGDTLFTSVPVADLTRAASSTSLYFPQVADGDGYTTSLILLNTSGATQTGTLRFYADDGTPMVVGRIDGASDTNFRYSIPAVGAYLLQTDGSPGTVHVGSLQLTPDTGTTTPVGAGLFSRTSGGNLVTESGVAAATPTNHARVYVDLSGGHDSGLALAATDGGSQTVTLRAYQADGATAAGAGSATVNLGGNGHRAAFVGQWISGLPANFRGVLDISAPATFAALTLRSLVNGRGDFLLTTFPIADLTRSAPAPLVFQQIAAGGGYQTEFILLSSGAAAILTLSLFDDNGSPLAVPK